jgi:hypothetical protein
MEISTFRKLCSLNASLVDYYGETEKKKPPKRILFADPAAGLTFVTLYLTGEECMNSSRALRAVVGRAFEFVSTAAKGLS